MMQIIIVDDHDETLAALEEILNPYYKVNSFLSYKDCESFLLSNKSEIRYVCIDYHLGDKNNGLIYIKKIREILNKEVPFSLISGANDIDFNLFISLKRSHFIKKPYDPDELLHDIKKHIESEEFISNDQLGHEIELIERNT